MLKQFSQAGEVAQFIDDDQFGFGQSVEKCGYEIVALFWHSVQVGKRNPYAAKDIHAMAALDYRRFAGPDIPSNTNGMSLQQLADDLASHGFSAVPCPLSFDWIRGWLKYGYPVIVAVTEDSVFDVVLKAKPYPWNTTGYNHIILCTGPSSTPSTILVRDTANVVSPGIARPGPRTYDATKLHLLSATVVVPSWLPVPPKDFDPREEPQHHGQPIVQPSPLPRLDLSFQATLNERALWEMGSKQANFNDQWAICQSWIMHYRAGKWFGVPLEQEATEEEGNVMYKEQAFSGAYARWNSETGVVTWHDARGEVTP